MAYNLRTAWMRRNREFGLERAYRLVQGLGNLLRIRAYLGQCQKKCVKDTFSDAN